MAYDKSQLQKQLSQLETRFNSFQERRRHYDELVRRNTYVDLPPEVTGDLEPVQYQTATLEKDVYDHVDILRENPTRWDAVTFDSSEAAKKSERRVVLHCASMWAHVNRNRWWDAAVGEGQVRHGVKVTWHRWRQGKAVPFFLTNANIYGCYWIENEGEIDLFVYRYKVPVYEAGIKNKDGKRVTLDSMGNIGWLAEHEPHDQENNHEKMIEVTVCDYRSLEGEMCPVEGCEHPLRYISVYVNKDGSKIEDAAEADTFVSPFAKCSFKVTGGRVSFHETDPHQKYRPLMLPAYDVQEKLNYFNTLLATEVRKSYGDEDMYLDYSQAGPHIKLPEGGEQQTFERPKPGSSEMAAYPGEIKRFPKNIDPHLQKQIDDLNVLAAEFRPNRTLTGTAHSEASNATGTAYLALLEQAGKPYGGLLTNSDGTIREIAEDWLHAYRYWATADSDETTTEYTLPLTGEEQTMRYGKSYKAGETITINPKTDLKYDIEIVLKTESRSRVELQAAWLQAWDMYDKGVFTPEDLMKEGGIFDIEAQEEALYAAHVRRTLQPIEDEFMKQYILRVASNKTGMDFSRFIPMPQGEGTSPQNGHTPSMGETNLAVPPNAQMGRSAQQLELAANASSPNIAGGSEPGY